MNSATNRLIKVRGEHGYSVDVSVERHWVEPRTFFGDGKVKNFVRFDGIIEEENLWRVSAAARELL
jgi:hypothetical protein